VPGHEAQAGTFFGSGALFLTAGLLGLFAWMALLRPSVEGIPELAADASGRVLDLLEPLSTITYRWLVWYLGPVGVAVALVALVALAATALLRDRDRLSLALPGVVLTTTVLYLLSPNITPDHPWAMRRFLAVSIPGLLIAQGWALDRMWSWRPRSLRAVGPAAAVLVACATTFAVVDTSRPMREVEVGRGSLDAVEELCDLTGEAPTAILLAPEALYNATLPKAIRAWCGVPVAGAAPEITPAEVQRLADAWALEGRRLLVVSASGSPFEGLGGPVRDVSDSPLFAPEMTLTRRPERLAPDTRLVPGDGVLRLRVQEVAPRPAEGAQPAGEESAGSS
jgi:hypothetical protein